MGTHSNGTPSSAAGGMHPALRSPSYMKIPKGSHAEREQCKLGLLLKSRNNVFNPLFSLASTFT